MIASAPINLLGMDRARLVAWLAELNEKPFRANQLLPWLHQRHMADFSAMTNLPKQFRLKLLELAQVVAPQFEEVLQTSGDSTRKWRVGLVDAHEVEMVFIPEVKRGTLCISSQAGCAMACTFCATGYQGFRRNLTTAEIVGQLWGAHLLLAGAPTRLADTSINENEEDEEDETEEAQAGKTRTTDDVQTRAITNVVMMGMGEPLANVDEVLPALHLMLDDHTYGLSRRKVTISTAGWLPAMDRLAAECPVALAVSLHAPTDKLRDQLVPLNRKFPLAQLLSACHRYLPHSPRGFITFEYVMLDGINDTPACLAELKAIVRNIPCKINLIPFNPVNKAPYRPTPLVKIRVFAEALATTGVHVTIRKTRGSNIQAACGQLAGQLQPRLKKTHPIALHS